LYSKILKIRRLDFLQNLIFMRLNHRSLVCFLLGGIVLYICHGIAIGRNGASNYNFLLFCSAHFVWGYYWGGRLLVVDKTEEASDEG